MDQLILDVNGAAVLMPESRKGGYSAWEEDQSVDLTMIPGNMVKELRGIVWKIAYQYGYFNDEMKNRVISACRKGRREPLICSFLPPNGTEMVTSEFFVTSFSYPKYQWSREGRALWADFSMELREVDPHD